MSSDEKRILLIEDDKGMLEMLQGAIGDIGYSLEQTYDGNSGLEKARNGQYSLVIVDGNLPGISGFEVCRTLRSENKRLPVIMLTSRSDEIDRILGLELGADDYVTKPFSVRELAARIRGILWRASHYQNTESKEEPVNDPKRELKFGKLKIDPARRQVTVDDTKVEMTALEYDLLYYLASRPGIVVTRNDLLENVWGIKASNGDPTVTVTLSRVRIKIEPNPNTPIYIFTIRGVGYKFADSEY